MYGYRMRHEWAINRQADAARAQAAEYLQVIDDAQALLKMPGWDSAAADAQREKIQAILREAQDTAAELQRIGSDLNYFTATHKTWLEELEEAVQNALGGGLQGGAGGR